MCSWTQQFTNNIQRTHCTVNLLLSKDLYLKKDMPIIEEANLEKNKNMAYE